MLIIILTTLVSCYKVHHRFLVDRVDREDGDVEINDGGLTLVLRGPVLVVFLELSWQDVVKHQTCLRADSATRKICPSGTLIFLFVCTFPDN